MRNMHNRFIQEGDGKGGIFLRASIQLKLPKMGPGLSENGYFKWQFIPLIKKEKDAGALAGLGMGAGWMRAGSAAPAAQGAPAQPVALPLWGSRSLVPGPG